MSQYGPIDDDDDDGDTLNAPLPITTAGTIEVGGAGSAPSPTLPVAAPPVQYNTYANANAIFQAILDRPLPTDATTDAWATSDPHFAQDVAFSAESSTDLGNIFQIILNRPIPQANLSSIEAAEALGQISLQQVINGLATSPESTQDIENTFENILNRPIPQSYLTSVETSEALGQVSLQGFMNGVATSLEATQDIANIFQNLLDATVSGPATAWFEAQLASGALTMSGLLASVANSPSEAAVLNSMWQNATGQSIDPGNQAYWQGLMATGATLQTLASALSIYGPTVSAISDLWQGAFGTPIDPASLGGWEAAIASGATLATLATDLSFSGPVIANIAETWQQATGSAPTAAQMTYSQQLLANGGGLADVQQFAASDPNIVPAAAINPADPTNGGFPLQVDGNVMSIISTTVNATAPDFHQYGMVRLLGSYANQATLDAAQAAVDNASRYQPAPGAPLDHPVSDIQQEQVLVKAFGVLNIVGHVNSIYDDATHSVVNATGADHILRNGAVVRQTQQVGLNLYEVTYGAGNNTDGLLAWANGTLGASMFVPLDNSLASVAQHQTGYVGTLNPPAGSFSPLNENLYTLSGP